MALSALQKFALGRVDLEVADRTGVTPGDHDVDFVVRVQGKVKVGKPYPGTAVASIPWQKLFILALSKGNKATIDATAADMLKQLEGDGLNEAEYEAAKTRVEAALKPLLKTTEKEFNGKVTGSVVAQPVDLQGVKVDQIACPAA